MIITQEPTQSPGTLNGFRATDIRISWEQQDIDLALVIPLSVKMFDVFAQGHRPFRMWSRAPSSGRGPPQRVINHCLGRCLELGKPFGRDMYEHAYHMDYGAAAARYGDFPW
jgi:hypothetical protein